MSAPDPWDWYMATPFLIFVGLVVVACVYAVVDWLRNRK